MKKKVKKITAPRKIASKKIRQPFPKTGGVIAILAILCVGLFIVIIVLQSQQIFRPNAQTISGTNCRAAAGTCNPVSTCSTFETDSGQMDCLTGQTCCINPSTNANPAISTAPVPSANCIGSCTSPSNSPAPLTTQPPVSMTSPGATQPPSTSNSPVAPGQSGTPIKNPFSPIAQTSTTPAPSSNNNDLMGLIKQLFDLILKFLEAIMQHLGGSNSGGNNGGDKD